MTAQMRAPASLAILVMWLEVVVALQLVVLVVVPARLWCAEDELWRLRRMLLHRLGDALKVEHLTGIEILRELNVGAPDPPVVRQPDREIAAVLRAHPAADAILRRAPEPRLAEHVIEGTQAVIPVVVAGQYEQKPPPRAVGGSRQRGLVGKLEAVAVSLAARERIDLVAAHDEQLTGGQLAHAFDVEARRAD